MFKIFYKYRLGWEEYCDKSYTWNDAKEKVYEDCERLMANGVDVSYDNFLVTDASADCYNFSY